MQRYNVSLLFYFFASLRLCVRNKKDSKSSMAFTKLKARREKQKRNDHVPGELGMKGGLGCGFYRSRPVESGSPLGVQLGPRTPSKTQRQYC